MLAALLRQLHQLGTTPPLTVGDVVTP